MTPAPPQAGGRKPQDDYAALADELERVSEPHSYYAWGLWLSVHFNEVIAALRAGGTGGGGQPPTPAAGVNLDKVREFITERRGWTVEAPGMGLSIALGYLEQCAAEVQALRDADPARRQQTPPADATQGADSRPAATAALLMDSTECMVGVGHPLPELIRRAEEDVRAGRLCDHSDVERELGGDAPPRPPQERRHRKGYCDNCGERNTVVGECPPPCRDCHGTLCERCCDEAKSKRATQPTAAAPTPAPTLTAEDRVLLDQVRAAVARNDDAILGGLLAIIDRCLLAADAPTAASAAQIQHEPWEVTRQRIRAAGGAAWDRVKDPDAFIRWIRGYEDAGVCQICGGAGYEMCSPVACPACDGSGKAGADAAPAAEGASDDH